MWLSVFPHRSPLSALLPSFLLPFYTSFLLLLPSLFLRWQSYCVAQASLYWAFWCGVEHVPLNLRCVFVQHIDHSFPSSIKKKINGKRFKTEVLCFLLAVDFCFSWKHQSNLQLGFSPYPPQWQPQQLFTRCRFCWGFVFPLWNHTGQFHICHLIFASVHRLRMPRF